MIGIYEIEDTETEVNITQKHHNQWVFKANQSIYTHEINTVYVECLRDQYVVIEYGKLNPSAVKDTLQEAKLYALALIIRNS